MLFHILYCATKPWWIGNFTHFLCMLLDLYYSIISTINPSISKATYILITWIILHIANMFYISYCAQAPVNRLLYTSAPKNMFCFIFCLLSMSASWLLIPAYVSFFIFFYYWPLHIFILSSCHLRTVKVIWWVPSLTVDSRSNIQVGQYF